MICVDHIKPTFAAFCMTIWIRIFVSKATCLGKFGKFIFRHFAIAVFIAFGESLIGVLFHAGNHLIASRLCFGFGYGSILIGISFIKPALMVTTFMMAPMMTTMVMLAIVVLGLFSYQRLKVDQFPNIDFPVVVVTAEYPGASPEIVESEVDAARWLVDRPRLMQVLGVATHGLPREVYAMLKGIAKALDPEEQALVERAQRTAQLAA